MSYTPKNNFNLQLGRTGIGKRGFMKKLLADVACCDKTDYQLYGGFQSIPSQDLSRELMIRGGCPNFSWDIGGSYFSFTDAITSGRTNTINADVSTPFGTEEIATITDACGNKIYIKMTLIGLICGIHEIGIEDTSFPGYTVYGAGYDSGIGPLGIGATGPTHNKTFLPFNGSLKFIDVSCGYSFTITRTKYGTLYATGDNSKGQYGNGTTVNSTELILVSSENWSMLSVGVQTVMVLKNDNTIWGTGDNSKGQLGVDDEVERHSFIQEISLQSWKLIDCRSSGNALAIRNNGLLFGTGTNGAGQLSQRPWYAGPDPRFPVFTQIKYDDGGSHPFPVDNSTWKFATCGNNCSYAIKDNGTLWVTGFNNRGQLGLGDTTTRRFFEQVGSSLWTFISAAEDSVVGIKEDGTLWGWGFNNYGELGLGDKNQRNSPVQISSIAWKNVSLLFSRNLVAIKDSDDTLWGCGRNANYELGLNHQSEVLTLTQEINQNTWIAAGGGSGHTVALLL